MRLGTVDIWWARLTDAGDDLYWLLNEPERQRYADYRRPEDAARFLLGTAMLRAIGARYLGVPAADVPLDRTCPTCGRPHGKVTVPGADLHVSVSHSGEQIGVAAHLGAPIGLDVEQRKDRLDVAGLARQALAPSEAARLGITVPPGPADRRDAVGATDPLGAGELGAGELGAGELGADQEQRLQRDFLRYWTRKEAVLKCTGDGLRVALATVVVSAPDEEPRLREFPGRPELTGEISLYDLPDRDDHLAALAVWRADPVRIAEHAAISLLAQVRRPAW